MSALLHMRDGLYADISRGLSYCFLACILFYLLFPIVRYVFERTATAMQQPKDFYKRFAHCDARAQEHWGKLPEDLQGLLDTTRKIMQEAFDTQVIILEFGSETWQPKLCVVAEVSHLSETQAEDILISVEETWGKTFLKRIEKSAERAGSPQHRLMFGFTRRLVKDNHVSNLETVYAFHEDVGDVPF